MGEAVDRGSEGERLVAAADVPRSAPSQDVTVIQGDAQLRALANPERVRILGELVDRPATAKQLAEGLGATRGRVHYHVKELERAGLVEIVARVERRGVVEKYYRAVARNFYLGRGIGEYDELEMDMQRSVNSRVLSWRREQILEVDQNEIARRIVEDCLATREDDVVLIEGGFVHRQIIEPLTKAVQCVGGRCLVAYRPCNHEDLLLKWKDEISSLIVVEEPLDYPLGNGFEAVPEDAEDYEAFLRRLVASGGRFLYAGIAGHTLERPTTRNLIESGKRFVYVGYPTPQRARVMGIDFRDLHDACWTALDVDYGRLAERCAAAREALQEAREVRVTSPGGTDLSFSIEDREPFVDDGVISEWEVEHGRGWGQLPAGKVMVAPRPGTAAGVVVSEVTDYFGVRIEGLRIEFEKGQVKHASAERNDDLLQLVLSSGGQAARQFSGFDVGLNEQIRDPVGYAVWDSKCYGSVTLSIGNNRLIGGENGASLSWGFLVTRPTVELDGDLLLVDRRFTSLPWAPSDATGQAR